MVRLLTIASVIPGLREHLTEVVERELARVDVPLQNGDSDTIVRAPSGRTDATKL